MKLNLTRDGHVHSPFCPHGCDDEFEMYIEKAIEKGLTEITFTEHMPLPLDKDPSPRNNSAMKIEDVEPYLKAMREVKDKYKSKIKINVGFEVDYIEGREKEIEEMLNKYGSYIDDAILSVHVLKYEDELYAIGSGVENLMKLVDKLGGMDKVYELYYETMLKSVQCNLGKYKPKRIGHPTLVRKYRTDLPNEKYDFKLVEKVVKEIKKKGYEIDVNTSGIRKEKCKEIYPSGIFMELSLKYNVSMVLGSDSHSHKEVGLYFSDVEEKLYDLKGKTA